MKSSHKDSTIDTIKENFVKTNESLTQVKPKELLKIFLKTFHDAYANQAILRVQFVPELMKVFGISVKDFEEIFNQIHLQLAKEDVPFMKKSVGTLLHGMIREFGFSLESLKFEFDGDEFSKEDQSWFYREALEELGKIPGTEDLKEAISKATDEAKKFK